MEVATLEERVLSHSRAFDGLLSLIPAKLYYGEQDTSNQWKKKKQTKEQAAAAKRAKLNPDSMKTALDVLNERGQKRKSETVEEDDDVSEIDGVEKEQPKQGLKTTSEPQTKKQRTEKAPSDLLQNTLSADGRPVDSTDGAKQKAERRRLKQERKKEKSAAKAEKVKSKKKDDNTEHTHDAEEEKTAENPPEEIETEQAELNDEEKAGDEIDAIDMSGLVEEDAKEEYSASSSSNCNSPFEPATIPSTSTSTSSIIPPATAPKYIKLPSDPELLRSRLAARIEALRAARKADGPNGQPARNRQELMEARRMKEEQRKAHKKELRMQAKMEEEARREQVLESARQSPMSPAIHSPSENNNFSFGRVSFADGSHASHDLSTLLSAHKRKGNSDPATALKAAEAQRSRLAGLDADKRANVEEKDSWLNARKRAHGEKVRDDTSLLKKALKRKEKGKKKSEKEWGERKDAVAKGQAMRQKKREDNLQKRRDEKGTRGGKKKPSKPKNRPGFEGSFRSGGGKRK